MKKLILIITMSIITVTVANAQAILVSIFNNLRSGDFHKAHELVDQVIKGEEHTELAKTWFYAGNTYLQLYIVNSMVNSLEKGMTDEALTLAIGKPERYRNTRVDGQKGIKWIYDTYDLTVTLVDDKVIEWNKPKNGAFEGIVSQEEALTKAKEYYIKAMQIDPRESNNMLNPVAPPVGLELVLTGFINQGAVLYTQNKIPEAHKMFMESVQLSAMLGKPNEYAMFLAARTARLDSNFVVADQIYATLVEIKSTNPDVYAEYARMLTNDGEYEKALEVVNKGYEIDEQNREIMLSEADIYLSQKDFVKTKEVLEQILVNDPDNAELNYYIGDMYNEFTKDSAITEEQFLEYLQEANKYYQRALKIKPDFMNAVFNNGIIYFNYGVEVIRQIQELPPSANVEYNRGKQKADSLFRIALPLLERALELSPEDMPTIYTLRQIYTRLDMMDKAIEMKKLYDKLAAEIKKEEE